MSLDPVLNFAIVTVSTGYVAGATSIVLSSGHGTKLPQPSTDGAFNLVWWDSTTYPNPADDPNVEIVRCTARSTDTLTVTRAQEGTSDVNHNTGGKTYKMLLSITKKMIDNIGTGVKRILVFPASCFETRAATGWAEFEQTQGTNFDYGQLNFDTATDEKVISPPFVMEDYDLGNITIKIGWKGNATSGNVVWVASFNGVADDEAWDVALTDHAFAAKTIGDVAYDMMISSLTVDPAELVADEATVMKIYRDVSEDTLAVDAQLLWVQIQYSRI